MGSSACERAFVTVKLNKGKGLLITEWMDGKIALALNINTKVFKSPGMANTL